MRSLVSAIIDADGYIQRIVVTERERMCFHVGRGEQLIVVPDWDVQEPVAWSEIPEVIRRVEACVRETIR